MWRRKKSRLDHWDIQPTQHSIQRAMDRFDIPTPVLARQFLRVAMRGDETTPGAVHVPLSKWHRYKHFHPGARIPLDESQERMYINEIVWREQRYRVVLILDTDWNGAKTLCIKTCWPYRFEKMPELYEWVPAPESGEGCAAVLPVEVDWDKERVACESGSAAGKPCSGAGIEGG